MRTICKRLLLPAWAALMMGGCQADRADEVHLAVGDAGSGGSSTTDGGTAGSGTGGSPSNAGAGGVPTTGGAGTGGVPTTGGAGTGGVPTTGGTSAGGGFAGASVGGAPPDVDGGDDASIFDGGDDASIFDGGRDDGDVDAEPEKYVDGQACITGSQCASDICEDGYCCNAVCTGACMTCGKSGSEGSCVGVAGTDDADTCTGAYTCSSSGACRLEDGESCSVPGDCANDNCTTYYPDVDGDTYGSNSSSVRICSSSAPAGMVTNGADCCDVDPNAYPGVNTGGYSGTGYWVVQNACGSFDYDCDGVESLKIGFGFSYPLCEPQCTNQLCLADPVECGSGAIVMVPAPGDSCDVRIDVAVCR